MARRAVASVEVRGENCGFDAAAEGEGLAVGVGVVECRKCRESASGLVCWSVIVAEDALRRFLVDLSIFDVSIL